MAADCNQGVPVLTSRRVWPCLVALTLIAACGADPAMTAGPDRVRVVTTAEPAHARSLQARWEAEAVDAYVHAATWVAMERWVWAVSARYAVAVQHARFVALQRTELRPTSSAGSTRPRPAIADGSTWGRLSMCESGGDPTTNTGNGFFGAFQFTVTSWRAVGGSGLPSNASYGEQVSRAQALQRIQGWGAWPACSRKLGLR